MRVSVSMRVSVPVTVLLGLLAVLVGGLLLLLLGVSGCQWCFVGRRVGCLELCELCVVVTVVAGDGCAVWVWMREDVLGRRCETQSCCG